MACTVVGGAPNIYCHLETKLIRACFYFCASAKQMKVKRKLMPFYSHLFWIWNIKNCHLSRFDLAFIFVIKKDPIVTIKLIMAHSLMCSLNQLSFQWGFEAGFWFSLSAIHFTIWEVINIHLKVFLNSLIRFYLHIHISQSLKYGWLFEVTSNVPVYLTFHRNVSPA